MTKANIQLAKVAGAYIGAGVLALEAYNVLTATLNVPTWVYWLAILAVVSGLPLVVLAAIAHIREDDDIEADPWMVRAPRALVIATLVMVLGGGGGIAYWVVGAEDGVKAREDAMNAPSIAVMPFENQSPDPEDAFFADGLTDELTRVFTGVAGIRVMAGEAVADTKGGDTEVDVMEAARELGVRTVLEGSVRKSGNHIRVTADLINAEDRQVLWSQKYDTELTDVFAVQDEISAAIVAELSPTIQGAKAGPLVNFGYDWGTENSEAYMHFLRGRSLESAGTDESLVAAREAYAAAVAADPDYTVAQEALTALGG